MNNMRTYSYTRLETEDTDERKHRRAQFLIYKALEEAECRRRSRSFPRVLMISKFKIKIGGRFMRVRKSARSTISRARVCVTQKVGKQLKLWKRALCGKDDAIKLTPLLS